MKKLTTGELFYGPPSDEAELRSLSRFLAPDPFFVLRVRGRLHFLVSSMEEGRARRTVPGARVWTPAALGLDPAASPADLVARASGRLGAGGWRVTRAFPLYWAEALRARGLSVEVRRDDPRRRRSVKTDREIALLRRSQRATAGALRRARRILCEATVGPDGRLRWEGATLSSERLRAAIEGFLLEREFVCEGTIVACGRQGADPHERGSGPLRAGEFIVLDIFPRDRRTGYWGDMTRTVVKGAASAEQRRRHRAVLRAQREALSRIRPGARCAEIHEAVLRSLEQDGFPSRRVGGRMEGMIHGTGHGVGLEIHEAPRLARTPGRLRAGQVVSVEPGLYSRAAGGLRIEDLVVVTRDGCRKLASAPVGLVLP